MRLYIRNNKIYTIITIISLLFLMTEFSLAQSISYENKYSQKYKSNYSLYNPQFPNKKLKPFIYSITNPVTSNSVIKIKGVNFGNFGNEGIPNTIHYNTIYISGVNAGIKQEQRYICQPFKWKNKEIKCNLGNIDYLGNRIRIEINIPETNQIEGAIINKDVDYYKFPNDSYWNKYYKNKWDEDDYDD